MVVFSFGCSWKFRCSMAGVSSSLVMVQRIDSLWMISSPPPGLLVQSWWEILYPSRTVVAVSGAKAELRNRTLGTRVAMRSHTSVACLQSERELRRMHASWSGGVWGVRCVL